ncbi:MAG: NAD(+) synthase [Lachnospiraceae bacterium]|nr:NAD(+) synthase [Lachnospiraceae bacterium]
MRNQWILAAAAVPSLKIADVTYNTDQILKVIRENRECGIIVFPELCVTGYSCGDLFGSRLLLDKAEDAMFEIAWATEGLEGLTLVIGLPIRLDNNLYNCAAIISQGRVRGLIPKQYIPSYSEFYEGRWFSSGKGIIDRTLELHGESIPFGVDILAEDRESGAVLGVEICEDLWVPDKPSTHLCLAGANIIANPSASDELIGKQEYRRQLVGQQSGSCYCAYIYASSGMDESSTDLVFSGHTLIAQSGRLVNEDIFPTRPSLTTAAVDLAMIQHDRIHQNTFDDSINKSYRRVSVGIGAFGGKELSAIEMADILKSLSVSIDRNPFVPEDDVERGDRCRKILRIQANGLATRVRATGIFNLVIGISGGLDSTLALLVCGEARKIVPQIRILAYTMPNEGNTSGLTYRNAKKLMQLIADETYELAIHKGVQMHLQDIGHSPDYEGEGDATYENAQARMRTYILMDAANMRKGLVVGTGDLSELALGWCTYNGDHMSMYAVNASIPKTLVQYICRTYGETCQNEDLREVIFSICDTPITPELTPNDGGRIAQMTEEKIGKYDLNDFFLYYTLRYGFEPSRSLAYAMRAYPDLDHEQIKNAAKRFFSRFFTQQFKRSCLPDGPKVGSVSLSPRGDWRMPSDASMHMWLRDLEEEQ